HLPHHPLKTRGVVVELLDVLDAQVEEPRHRVDQLDARLAPAVVEVKRVAGHHPMGYAALRGLVLLPHGAHGVEEALGVLVVPRQFFCEFLAYRHQTTPPVPGSTVGSVAGSAPGSAPGSVPGSAVGSP